ncbi:hypothetical protein [Enhydrobacter sp.]|jgi:hypothetical protein|uniref:hypothetical protein n=1 Tax=Enhydrobacter sp. TaxID=1894999 RepID=UPI0026044EFE|nr:hypothetical protein [Enhydrobacter sp.]WIM11659.1 MAG: hypothetical protein OJF58_002618 [Enhydrobacter sp.]
MTVTRNAAAYIGALPAHRRKKIAEVAIDHVLTLIKSGARPDGLYERYHIELAIDHLRRGHYQHAWTEGLLAEARMDRRTIGPAMPEGSLTPASIEALRRDFAEVQAEPASEWVALT